MSCTGMNNILEKQVCCQLTCESSIWPWRSTKSCLSNKNQLFLQRNWSWSEPSLTLLLLSMVVYLRQMLETSTQLAPLLSFYAFICFHLTQWSFHRPVWIIQSEEHVTSIQLQQIFIVLLALSSAKTSLFPFSVCSRAETFTAFAATT